MTFLDDPLGWIASFWQDPKWLITTSLAFLAVIFTALRYQANRRSRRPAIESDPIRWMERDYYAVQVLIKNRSPHSQLVSKIEIVHPKSATILLDKLLFPPYSKSYRTIEPDIDYPKFRADFDIPADEILEFPIYTLLGDAGRNPSHKLKILVYLHDKSSGRTTPIPISRTVTDRHRKDKEHGQ